MHERFGREGIYISSVRDPIERFESYFNFVRALPQHRHHENANKHSIGEFFRLLKSLDDIELFNLQCLTLCRERDFRTARQFVIDRYSYVIPLKHFAPMTRLVMRKLGWPAMPIPVLNVTEHKVTADDLTEADRAGLVAGNAADRDLVAFCQDRAQALMG